MLNQLQYCEETGIPFAIIIGESELQVSFYAFVTCVAQYRPCRLIRSQIRESVAYCNQILPVLLYKRPPDNSVFLLLFIGAN